jgi:hypothetical protein
MQQADYLLTILDELGDLEQDAHDLRVALSQALARPLEAVRNENDGSAKVDLGVFAVRHSPTIQFTPVAPGARARSRRDHPNRVAHIIGVWMLQR